MALLAGLAPRRRPDVLYVYHPPLTSGISAALYSRATGVPFVLDVQDLWPDAIVAAGYLREGGRAFRAIRAVEDFVYRRATRISVISEGMRSNLMAKGVAPTRLHVISNWGDPGVYFPAESDDLRRSLDWSGCFVVTVAGNLGLTHGLETVLDAARLLGDIPQIRIAFVGAGGAKPELVERARTVNLGNVEFHDHVPEEGAARIINASDAMLVHLKPAAGGEFSVPHRIFSYMLCGKPIVAAASGSVAQLIRSFDCGWVCPPSDPPALAEAIRAAAADPERARSLGQNGLAVSSGDFSREQLLGRIERLVAAAADHARHMPEPRFGESVDEHPGG
jgi:glycosyltransferase involved in cell wall biosynthesis